MGLLDDIITKETEWCDYMIKNSKEHIARLNKQIKVDRQDIIQQVRRKKEIAAACKTKFEDECLKLNQDSMQGGDVTE